MPKDSEKQRKSTNVKGQVIAFPVRNPFEEIAEKSDRSTQPRDVTVNNKVISTVLTRPFDYSSAMKIIANSEVLLQCINAMQSNVDGFGHRFEVVNSSLLEDEKYKEEVEAEKLKLSMFFDYCNFKKSFSELRMLLRKDIEMIGYGCLEVIRDGKNEIAGFEYCPATSIHWMSEDVGFTEVEIKRLNTETYEWDNVKSYHRFRRYAQNISVLGFSKSTDQDTRTVYYKELGDPRVIDNRSGKVVPVEEIAITPQEYRANELLVLDSGIYFDYAIPFPRWYGNLINILGDLSSQNLNYNYFSNGKMQRMAILISNGMLTEKSSENLREMLRDNKGIESSGDWMVMEAEPFLSGDNIMDDKLSPAKIELKSLTESIPNDGLFQEYKKNCQSDISSAYRLPPIFLGRAQEYNYASAHVSRAVAEEQIFLPERRRFDHAINRLVLTELGIKYHRFVSNTPDLSDYKQVAEILDIFNKMGTVTPNEAREILSPILSKELPPIKEDWGDMPFSMSVKGLDFLYDSDKGNIAAGISGNDGKTEEEDADIKNKKDNSDG